MHYEFDNKNDFRPFFGAFSISLEKKLDLISTNTRSNNLDGRPAKFAHRCTP